MPYGAVTGYTKRLDCASCTRRDVCIAVDEERVYRTIRRMTLRPDEPVVVTLPTNPLGDQGNKADNGYRALEDACRHQGDPARHLVRASDFLRLKNT